MRGFNESKTNTGSVLGERFFSMIQTQQEKQNNSNTKDAKKRFKAKPYDIGHLGERAQNGRSKSQDNI